MQQLLKFLDDNSYVSRYRTCENGVIVRDIFWTHPDFIKLFNMFPTLLILDSTYKTNKYRLPLLEMVGVTSTKKTYSVGFTFLKSEKEENFTWALEVCRAMLKDQVEMLKSWYPITNNVRSRVKPAVGKKHIEFEDRKMVKAGVIVEKIIDVWNRTLVGNISRAGLKYIFHEAKRADNVGSDSAKCGCTIVKTYGLSCTSVIAKKMKFRSPIRLDEICTHWKRLRFDDDGDMKKIAYLETTDLKSLSQPVKIKGAPKKLKPTPSDNSTMWSPSHFEHVDSFSGARISKPLPTPPPPKTSFIDEMPIFMHKYIEWIVNIEGDDNCGYRVVSALLGK
ncbi:uncharacterized protein LOC127135052 [Lathyrus oleraceus]|uniref:uncharacterized protein LOC127135052 n=1 Tax=Pisum sativum TaxID=3888 RepID=UPI0021D122B5|nr:uncharacterized protein LOC127135052 [Pisum sativum]